MSSKESPSFEGLGIASKLLAILQTKGFTVPTPIQFQSIPVAIDGKDVIGIAQTGTGKTLAFGIPMLQRLASLKGIGLVVLPTRELALQVNESLQKIGGSLGLKTAIIIGGEPISRQFRALKANPHIVIATPGRLNDHIDQKTIHLDKVNVLVLDEADRMLDMGFAPQIERILKVVPKERQTMLFSATMPEAIVGIASKHMKLPVRVEVAPAGTANKNVSQELFFVPKDSKLSLLKKTLGEYQGTVLVFTRTKFGAKKVAHVVREFGFTAAEIHSNRSLAQRLEALKGFKTGKYRVLVATDVVARGLDVTGIELVINYDLPENPEDYVHRIGRTGRADRTGHAISFATPDQKRDVRDIERLIRAVLPISKTADLPVVSRESLPKFEERPERSSSNYRGSRGGFGSKSQSHSGSSRDFKPRQDRKDFKQASFKPRDSKSKSYNPKEYTPKSALGSERVPQTEKIPGLLFRFGGESVADKHIRVRDNRRPFDKKRSNKAHSKPSFGNKYRS